MTLKELLLQELETSDDALIAEILAFVRSRKAPDPLHSPQPPSGEPIQRGAKLGDLLQFARTWVGDDLEECLETVYATRSQATFNLESDPFQ
jgi:hypothetical protein